MEQLKTKILLFDELADKIVELKAAGKVVVQSHGIFDLIHPGILMHLDDACSQGDVLIVTVIKDKDVRRGPGRPIFPEDMRARNAAALAKVDYFCIVNDASPFESVKTLRPNVLAKGQGYRGRHKDIHEKLEAEERGLYFDQISIHETRGFSFSSSTIVNNFLDIYSEETKQFIKEFNVKYGFNYVADRINELNNMKVLLIGDGIIDEYFYTEPMGRSAKANLVVNKYLSCEAFAGGAFAIANHLASFCGKVHLMSLIGELDTREEFIRQNLKPNVEVELFTRSETMTVIKKRYLQENNKQKLFEINYLHDVYISGDIEERIIENLKKQILDYDVVLISDFGHGFITENIVNCIKEAGVRFGVNAQTNGANAGFNLITKYSDPYFVCLDEAEVRLAMQERFMDVKDIIPTITNSISAQNMIVTLGNKGSIGINRDGIINTTPIFSSKVVDTVGAGDAFFSYTSSCLASGMPMDAVSFVGNAVGALAVQILGNKKAVEKHELLEFIHAVLK